MKPPNIKPRENISIRINILREEKGMSQGKLAKISCLSKARISRICRDSNDRGGLYKATVSDVMALAIGLNLNKEEGWDLFFSAFPELELFEYLLEKKLSVEESNDILDDLGLNSLGDVT
jgi:transcriptional regulator with XRE-family HTH domain